MTITVTDKFYLALCDFFRERADAALSEVFDIVERAHSSSKLSSGGHRWSCLKLRHDEIKDSPDYEEKIEGGILLSRGSKDSPWFPSAADHAYAVNLLLKMDDDKREKVLGYFK